MNITRRPSVPLATALLTLAFAVQPVARADDENPGDSSAHWAPCDRCRIWIGVGTTYTFFKRTDGLVVPFTLELADSRWELGAFRMARSQLDRSAPENLASPPYWGFSAMHRWQILHRGAEKVYFGFGANYLTQESYVNSSLWNFAYLIGVRVALDGGKGPLLELTVRHWSNAWLKPPNRGQNFVTVSASF